MRSALDRPNYPPFPHSDLALTNCTPARQRVSAHGLRQAQAAA